MQSGKRISQVDLAYNSFHRLLTLGKRARTRDTFAEDRRACQRATFASSTPVSRLDERGAASTDVAAVWRLEEQRGTFASSAPVSRLGQQRLPFASSYPAPGYDSARPAENDVRKQHDFIPPRRSKPSNACLVYKVFLTDLRRRLQRTTSGLTMLT
ncbi:unnamed protein product [Boreogadus saida]